MFSFVCVVCRIYELDTSLFVLCLWSPAYLFSLCDLFCLPLLLQTTLAQLLVNCLADQSLDLEKYPSQIICLAQQILFTQVYTFYVVPLFRFRVCCFSINKLSYALPCCLVKSLSNLIACLFFLSFFLFLFVWFLCFVWFTSNSGVRQPFLAVRCRSCSSNYVRNWQHTRPLISVRTIYRPKFRVWAMFPVVLL